MTNPSNLYAERVFAEHPLALWSLDDNLDYLSLIDESDRNISTWTVSGGTAEELDIPVSRPFPDSYAAILYGDIPEETEISSEAILTSQDTFNFSDLNQNMGTFSLGAYIYANNGNLQSVSIGYSYDSGNIEVIKSFTVEASNSWIFVSETFDIPDVDDVAKIIIKISYYRNEQLASEYEFYVNGVTAGQWSEEFSATSLGITKGLLPDGIAVDATYAVPAKVYGIQDLDGYYLIENTSEMLAKNTGIPLVYGASNVTTLYPSSDGSPSLILPGQGFLNSTGQSLDYTAEMWIRVNGTTAEPKRIFGPIASTDGLYIDGPYIALKLNDEIRYHFVGKWYRPMLVQILISNLSAGLVVNGEQVISIEANLSTMTFPDETNELGESQDWLGFYSYDSISSIEIDCVSVYPYTVPTVLCKRRWIYGQAVESIETINKTFDGSTATIDYQFSEYSNSYAYPDIGRWEQGVLENIRAERNYIATPNYDIPDIAITEIANDERVQSAKTYSDLLIANSNAQSGDPFFTMFPDEDWDGTSSYFNLSSLSLATSQTKAIYLVFDEISSEEETQTLFHIQDKRSSDYLQARLDDGKVKYAFKFGQNDEQIIAEFDSPSLETKTVVGVNFRKISDSIGGDVQRFFGSPSALELYVLNSPDLLSPFVGRMYKLSLLTTRNITDILSSFNDDGVIVSQDSVSSLISHKSSYSIEPSVLLENFKVSVSSSSYWEDYIPLTYFAKYSKDSAGLDVYTLDLLQFNIDYQSPIFIDGINSNASGTDIKTYISFQPLSSGANKNVKSIANTVELSETMVVSPGEEWADTKYEVADGAVIYLPPFASFEELAIVVHLFMDVSDITTKPLQLRSLQIASQSYSATSATKVGTRFGVPMYPYKKSGIYFDYKSKNPVSIYKESTPYLYLTRDSGISVLGEFDPKIERGVSIPINTAKLERYKISTMQTFLRFDKDRFPETPTQIFEVQAKGTYIKFFMVSTDPQRKRAKVYAVDANTGRVIEDLVMFWNGVLVTNPVISLGQWGVLGVVFGSRLNFDAYQGALRLTGPLTFNHMSYHTLTELQEIQQASKRSWLRVLYTGDIQNDWEYWADNFTWSQVLILNTARFYGANPANMFKSYSGSNKVIGDDDSIFFTNSYHYKFYSKVQSDTYMLPAV